MKENKCQIEIVIGCGVYSFKDQKQCKFFEPFEDSPQGIHAIRLCKHFESYECRSNVAAQDALKNKKIEDYLPKE